MPLSVREWVCPVGYSARGKNINAAQNLHDFGPADSLGHSNGIRCSPAAIPVGAETAAEDVGRSQHGTQEAPAIAVSPA